MKYESISLMEILGLSLMILADIIIVYCNKIIKINPDYKIFIHPFNFLLKQAYIKYAQNLDI
jgi:hypothetical protein